VSGAAHGHTHDEYPTVGRGPRPRRAASARIGCALSRRRRRGSSRSRWSDGRSGHLSMASPALPLDGAVRPSRPDEVAVRRVLHAAPPLLSAHLLRLVSLSGCRRPCAATRPVEVQLWRWKGHLLDLALVDAPGATGCFRRPSPVEPTPWR